MKTATIYLNSHFEVTEAIRSAALPSERFEFVCAYRREKFKPQGRVTSKAATRLGIVRTQPPTTFIREPGRQHSSSYARYCLKVGRKYGADVFLPGRQVSGISALSTDFERQGIRLVVPAGPSTLRQINHKGRFYQSVRSCGVPLPAYQQVDQMCDFEAAVRAIGRHHDVCYKPAVSIFGYGFHILLDHAGAGSTVMLQPGAPTISLPEALAKFNASGRFRTQLVMQHLPGIERSVDCLASHGRLLTGIVRRKNPDGTQFLEANEAVLAHVRTLVAHFKLSGLFNVQFKDDTEGTARLLEINPRMAGGISYSFHSGVVLPYWAIRLALGTACPGDIPQPTTGVLVSTRVPSLVRSI